MAIDEEGVRKAVRLFLTSIGENPDREGLLETPDRIARACEEIFSGLGRSPQEVLSKRFPVETDEMVLVRDIELFSVCEHHLLPFHASRMSATSRPTAGRRIEQARPTGGAVRASPAGAGTHYPAGRGRADGIRGRQGRHRRDRMRAHVHGDAGREQARVANHHIGGPRRDAHPGHPCRGDESDHGQALIRLIAVTGRHRRRFGD